MTNRVKIACPVCRGTVFEPLTRDNGYDWEVCDQCKYVRMTENITLEEATNLQGEEAAKSYIDAYIKKFEKKMARSRRRMRMLKRRMRGKDFLDVGSNYGFMVEAAHELGMNAVGIEINPTLVQAARERFPGRDFVDRSLEAVDLGDRKFDGVYCSEVIEHVADCRQFLLKISEVMRDGAVLYLTTPHIREMRRRNYQNMGAPDHKLYFNNSNIEKLLKETGFGKVNFRFNFLKGIELFAYRAA